MTMCLTALVSSKMSLNCEFLIFKGKCWEIADKMLL